MAIRGHAHSMGRSIIGYRLPHGHGPAQLLGRVNPQLPQAFYPLKQLHSKFDSVEIGDDDIIMARCIYDSTSSTHDVGMGPTHHDEMCNLYIMYHSSSLNTFTEEKTMCSSNAFQSKWKLIHESPAESVRKTISATKTLHDNEQQKSLPKLLLATNNSIESIESISTSKNTLLRHIDSLGQVSSVQTRITGNGQHELIILHRGTNTWNFNSFNKEFIYQNGEEYINTETIVHLNPITGDVTMKWGRNMFILPHSITLSYYDMNTNVTDDQVLRQQQQQRRYSEGKPTSVWITDVALHQVFKFDWMKWDRPSLTLGIPGKPGDNKHQFCQPTDVAISSTGDIFIADGYCNARIVKFSSNGTYLTEWSALGASSSSSFNHEYQHHDTTWHIPLTISSSPEDWSNELLYTDSNYPLNMDMKEFDFNIIHSLTIIPSDDDGTLEQICAADRENAAVLCYTLDGKLIRRYADSSLQPSIYAIQYDPIHKLIIGLTGSTYTSTVIDATTTNNDHLLLLPPNLFFINPYKPKNVNELKQHKFHPYWSDLYQGSALIGFYSMQNVRSPHDLTLSPTNDMIYVSEIYPYKVHQFKIQNNSSLAIMKGGQNDFVQPISLSDRYPWSLHTLTSYQLTGLSFLLFIIFILLLLGCIRLCWCRRHRLKGTTTTTIRRNKRELNGKVYANASPKLSSSITTTTNSVYSRWASKQNSKRNKQAGFRPLLRNNDSNDYLAEQELADYDYDDDDDAQNDDVDVNGDEDVLMDTTTTNYTDRQLLKQTNLLNNKQKFIPKVKTTNNAKSVHSNSLSSRLFKLKPAINKSDSIA
ncbi:unnamed protein product [Schistosoma turkestanicum]|nr:unnamed protein product [Schistosoma turkestanicum]